MTTHGDDLLNVTYGDAEGQARQARLALTRLLRRPLHEYGPNAALSVFQAAEALAEACDEAHEARARAARPRLHGLPGGRP